MRTTVIKVVLNAVIVIAVLELCARADDWIRYRAPPIAPSYTVDGLYEVQDGIRRGKAHARYQNWQLNSLGLRGPELSPGSRRVLCIGASETLGMLETPGMEFPRQLEHALRTLEPGKTIDVANLSYFGLTLITANKLLPTVMEEVHPEVVVIYPTYGGYVARQSRDVAADFPAQTPGLTLRLTEKVTDLVKAQLSEGLKTALRQREIQAFMQGRTAMERMPADRAEFLRHDLEKLVATIRRQGAEPVLVTHATRFNGNEDPQDRQYFLVSWRKFYPLFSAQALLDMEAQLNATVRDFAAQNGIPLVDAATQLPGGPKFFTDHEHFTNHGAGALADLIAPAVAPRITEHAASVVHDDTSTHNDIGVAIERARVD